jgi:hypothetical protein
MVGALGTVGGALARVGLRRRGLGVEQCGLPAFADQQAGTGALAWSPATHHHRPTCPGGGLRWRAKGIATLKRPGQPHLPLAQAGANATWLGGDP